MSGMSSDPVISASGFCTACGTVHSLPVGNSRKYALELMEQLEEFSEQEKELILRNTMSIQLTEGCGGGCSFCALRALLRKTQLEILAAKIDRVCRPARGFAAPTTARSSVRQERTNSQRVIVDRERECV
jgi:hypothetical protein